MIRLWKDDGWCLAAELGGDEGLVAAEEEVMMLLSMEMMVVDGDGENADGGERCEQYKFETSFFYFLCFQSREMNSREFGIFVEFRGIFSGILL